MSECQYRECAFNDPPGVCRNGDSPDRCVSAEYIRYENKNADLRALLEECLPYIESEIRYCDFQRDWDGCNKAKKLKAKLAAKLEEEK